MARVSLMILSLRHTTNIGCVLLVSVQNCSLTRSSFNAFCIKLTDRHGRARRLGGCRGDRPSNGLSRAASKTADLLKRGVEETLTYYAFPEEHWRRIRTNNPLERILREIRRRTRVVGAFPDGQSAVRAKT